MRSNEAWATVAVAARYKMKRSLIDAGSGTNEGLRQCFRHLSSYSEPLRALRSAVRLTTQVENDYEASEGLPQQ